MGSIATSVVWAGFRDGRTAVTVDLSGLPYKNPAAVVLLELRAALDSDVGVMHEPGTSLYTYTRTCQHTRVLEEYTRQSPATYTTRRTCTRCSADLGTVRRIGGESAKRRIVVAPHHLPLPGEEDYGEGMAATDGDGDGEPVGDAPPAQKQGKGTDEEQQGGKGKGGEDEGDDDGEGGGGEGEGEGDEEGEDSSEGGEGDSDGEGSEGDSDDDQSEGEGEGGEEDPLDAFVRVFLREWVAKTPDDSPVYRRVQVLQTQEVAK
jgi:hypothetical protein